MDAPQSAKRSARISAGLGERSATKRATKRKTKSIEIKRYFINEARPRLGSAQLITPSIFGSFDDTFMFMTAGTGGAADCDLLLVEQGLHCLGEIRRSISLVARQPGEHLGCVVTGPRVMRDVAPLSCQFIEEVEEDTPAGVAFDRGEDPGGGSDGHKELVAPFEWNCRAGG